MSDKASERNPWKDAIIDAAVVGWVYTAEHETNPRKAVNDLLCWERKMALDPAISKDAHDLVKRAEIAEQKVEQLRKMVAQFQEVLTQARIALARDAEAGSK